MNWNWGFLDTDLHRESQGIGITSQKKKKANRCSHLPLLGKVSWVTVFGGILEKEGIFPSCSSSTGSLNYPYVQNDTQVL